MHSFHYHQGQLRCEGADLAALAAEHGTPLYVYSAQTIRDHYRRLDAALVGLDHLICYAVKANSNLAVLNLLVGERSGFDIVSAGELFRVVHAGGKPEGCTFAGVGKTREEIEYALRQGVLSFNVESEAELEMINAVAHDLNLRAPVALRINPDVGAGGHKYISTGKSENKFGVGIDRALEVYKAAVTDGTRPAARRADAHRLADHRGRAVRAGRQESRARGGGVETRVRHRVFQRRRRVGHRLQILAPERPGGLVATGRANSRRTR